MRDDQNLGGIEKALDVLLGALHDFDLNKAEKPSPTGTRLSFADIGSVEIDGEPEKAVVSDFDSGADRLRLSAGDQNAGRRALRSRRPPSYGPSGQAVAGSPAR